MARGASIIRVVSCLAVLALMADGASADDRLKPRKKQPVSTEQPKYKLDLASDPPSSNSPAPPPGTSPLRRDQEGAVPFLGLKLSTPLGN
ncbi:hypothetical protein ASD45_09505 [Pseudolabrys sp. Root1462]|jgi:hypothetical protein|nr:hypothetical protein ASD45_09505 [Pseudolabrys sp. Root1462]